MYFILPSYPAMYFILPSYPAMYFILPSSYPALYSITYPPVYIVLPNEIDTLVEHTLSNEPHTQGVHVQVGEYLTIAGTGINILVVTHKLYGGMVY